MKTVKSILLCVTGVMLFGFSTSVVFSASLTINVKRTPDDYTEYVLDEHDLQRGHLGYYTNAYRIEFVFNDMKSKGFLHEITKELTQFTRLEEVAICGLKPDEVSRIFEAVATMDVVLVHLENCDDLAESVVHSLAKMMHLTHLKIYKCHNFNNDFIKSLSTLKNLETLEVRFGIENVDNFTALTSQGLEYLQNIKHLYVQGHKELYQSLLSLVEDVNKLPNLERLALIDFNLSDDDLRQLCNVNIKELYIRSENTHPLDFAFLKKLSSLELLSASLNEAVFTEYPKLPHLRELRWKTRSIPDVFTDWLIYCENLTKVKIDCYGYSGVGLGKLNALPKLEELVLNCELTRNYFVELCQLRNIKKLNVTYSLGLLQEAEGQEELLEIDDELKTLSQMRQLFSLQIGVSGNTQKACMCISSLPNLESLILIIDDKKDTLNEGVKHFMGSRLKCIGIVGDGLDSTMLDTICRFPTIKEIFIMYLHLSESDIRLLNSKSNIETVVIKDNDTHPWVKENGRIVRAKKEVWEYPVPKM